MTSIVEGVETSSHIAAEVELLKPVVRYLGAVAARHPHR